MTTARDVEAMLHRHYLPEGRPHGGILATEIMSPDGKRRADAMWVTTTTVGRGYLVGHEIKVTRADVIAELTDPTKMDAWARYCDEWWLTVSDPALVDGLDIPEHWGIMAPPSGRRTRTMTVLRKAARLHPIDKAEAMTRLLIWKHHKSNDEIETLRSDLRWREREVARQQATIDDLHASGARGERVSPHEQWIRDVSQAYTALITRPRDDGYLPYEVRGLDHRQPDEVAAALLDLNLARTAVANARRDIATATATLTNLRDPLARALDVLAQATNDLPTEVLAGDPAT